MEITGKMKHLLLKTVQDSGILPITSKCNLSCKFCSHKFNPPRMEVYSPGHLSLKLITELLNYLPPSGPIVIGESATRIIEGEPFLHPRIEEILSLLRKRYSDRLIKITTNGSLLTAANIRLLADIKPVELNVSLNCPAPEKRQLLMNDNHPETVFKALNMLSKFDLNFNGSLVAVPHLLDRKQREETIKMLSVAGAKVIRIFLPGFSKYAPREYWNGKPLILFRRIKDWLIELRKKYRTPLVLEPPLVKDLTPEIAGVIINSPADRAGLESGDIISEIDGLSPLSRVQAFNLIRQHSSPVVKINRNSQLRQMVVEKSAGQRSGLVMDYDLSAEEINNIYNYLRYNKGEKVVIITSKAAFDLIKGLINSRQMNLDKKEVQVIPVTNDFFGGTIISAGLLINEDIIKSLEKEDLRAPELLLLPGIIYDIYGNDLTGKGYEVISDYFSIPTQVIAT